MNFRLRMLYSFVALISATGAARVLAQSAVDGAPQAGQFANGRAARGGALQSLPPDQRQLFMKRLMQRRMANAGKPQEPPANLDDVTIKSNIAYGSDALQKLDLYTPKTSKAILPILIFVHGGGWSRGDKSQGDRKDKGCAYVAHDVIFITANYRLAPAVMHPEQAKDIASVFAWAKEHAKDFGGEPNRIFLMGHSAGAHLVDLIGTNDRFLKEKGLDLKDISGVISLDTASLNLTERRNDDGPETSLVGPMIDTAFGKSPQVLKDASPTLSIQPGKKYPPFLMFCGSKRINCVAQHKEFADLMRKSGGTVTVKAIPLSHGDINRASGQPDNEVFKDCLTLIKG